MNKDTFFGYLRTAMTIVGSLLVGKAIFGHNVDTEVINSVIGGALFVGSAVWGIVDKTATLEMITSALSKTITFIGGLFVTSGWLKDSTLTAIMGLVPLLAAEIGKRVNNAKEQKIVTGTMGVKDLKAATNVENKGGSAAPVINTPGK